MLWWALDGADLNFKFVYNISASTILQGDVCFKGGCGKQHTQYSILWICYVKRYTEMLWFTDSDFDGHVITQFVVHADRVRGVR